MRTYLTKRLLLMIPTLLGVAAVVFVIMRVIPGDVTLLILGGDQTGRIDPQQVAAMRHQLGLDQPLAVQFGHWLWGVLRLDFGNSLWTGQPVIEEVLIRLPLSLEVAILATIVSVLLAIPLGMLAAVRQDTWVDYVIRVLKHRGPGHPVVLGRDPRHPLPGDLLRLGPAARVHPSVGGPVGQLPAARLAGSDHRLSLRGGHHPDDPLHRPRGAARGLHPHRVGQGPAGSARW